MFSVVSVPVFMGLVFLLLMSFRDKRMTKNSESLGGHRWGLIQVNTPFIGGCRGQMFSRPKDFFYNTLMNIFV